MQFLKQGVVFKYLKLFHLNMRPDELNAREHYIKMGDFSRVKRKQSSDSSMSDDSNKSRYSL